MKRSCQRRTKGGWGATCDTPCSAEAFRWRAEALSGVQGRASGTKGVAGEEGLETCVTETWWLLCLTVHLTDAGSERGAWQVLGLGERVCLTE